MASRSAMTWNGGKTGMGRPPAVTALPGECPVEHCGDLAPAGSRRAGMVRVSVRGSREPARWYCPGWCARYGRALGDVRAIGGGAGA
ncbi:hypothetical protein I5Q34_01190 [Streptomyces sp. AV19]|uniref:hypothetical protein n=1 Tax=Streptomyces sp. AV19 TaxID=2793068 RepID=UPI0018FED9E4|nr:hypothetical protein [Streptomyces sp. AV19]MBH1932919.1 hypothetical protein [Streptomyces sp. AV19]MDG4531669.1 hypothetical protein [Streptomyces sp. AV19]